MWSIGDLNNYSFDSAADEQRYQSASSNCAQDIFAGFNVAIRSEISSHVDSLCWEKGRESSFNAAALFFTKVSKGNVGAIPHELVYIVLCFGPDLSYNASVLGIHSSCL